MSGQPGLSEVSSSDGSGLVADPAKAMMPPSLRAGTSVWTPRAAWLLQLEELGSQGGCHGLWTPLLPSGAAGNHPCALAAYCWASLHVPGPICHGAWIPRNQFSLGLSKGMWEMGQGLLNVAEFPEKLLESWEYKGAAEPASPEILSLWRVSPVQPQQTQSFHERKLPLSDPQIAVPLRSSV